PVEVIVHVADHTDDRHGRPARVPPESEPPAYHRLVGKKDAGRRLADDRDRRRAVRIVGCFEPAARNERDAQELGVAGWEGGTVPFGWPGRRRQRAALDEEGPPAAMLAPGNVGGGRGLLDSGQRTQPLEHASLKLDALPRLAIFRLR